MNRKHEEKLNRRDFVAASTAAVVGAACFSAGAKEAIAHARATGKTVLTAENLNRLFAEHRRAGRIKSVAHEINRDIPGWLKREYSLTPAQEKAIESISKEDWKKLSEVLRFVEDTGGTLSVTISDQSGTFKHHPSPLTCGVGASATSTDADGKTTSKEVRVEAKVGF